MTLVSIPHCPICSHHEFEEFLSCEDFTASHENFHLKTCRSCSFVMTDPRPDQDSIGNYYLSNKYISHTGGNKSLFDKIYVEARRITLRSKRKIIGNNSAGTKILDFGCGTGEFLNEMKTHGFDPIGVEPSSIARTTAIKKNGTKNLQPDLRTKGKQLRRHYALACA